MRAAQNFRRLDAVQTRHHDVQNEQMKCLRAAQLQHFRAIVRFYRLVAGGAKINTDGAGNFAVIIAYQDAVGHNMCPPCCLWV